MLRRSLLLLFALAAFRAGAEPFKSFWLTEAVSGRTVGPVVNKPGNRFTLNGTEWIVLQSKPGQIHFADAATLTPEGPYDLVEQRMVDLGPLAYVFTRIEDFDGADPTADRSVVTQANRAPAQKGRHPWSQDLPERWVLGPVPSTNPGAHKEMPEPWSLRRLELAPECYAFLEPLHRVQYDWELDSLRGKEKESLKTFRLGAAGEWNGFSGEAGLAAGGKTSGTLVDDSLALSGLRLDDGKGIFLGAAYDYRFEIEGGWGAAVGVYGAYERLSVKASCRSASLKGTAKREPAAGDGDGGDGDEASEPVDYGFHSWSSDFTFSELRAGVAAGIRYDEWYWGLGATFRIDCLDSVSADAGIPVLDERIDLDAERSQPVGLAFTGWYSPMENVVLEGRLAFGTETSLRLGAGVFF